MKFIIFIFILVVVKTKCQWHIDAPPIAKVYPCLDNNNVSARYYIGLAPELENQYDVEINRHFERYSVVQVRFDSEAIVQLEPPSNKAARISVDGNTFVINYFKEADSLDFKVSGTRLGVVPYIIFLFVDGKLYCKKPRVGYFDDHIIGYKDTASARIEEPDDSCGRKKVKHTELIVNGVETKPGDWPWHVAIFRHEKRIFTYICGGTLVAKHWILTAAHCVTVRGDPVIPDSLHVILGKHNLIGGDIAPQEKEIFEVVVHPNFMYKRLENDIALLKLKAEANFDDYVQPSCLWYETVSEKLSSGEVHGTVVGWGINENDKLTTELRQATAPIVSEATCIKSNPLFYSKLLDDNKFCAGLRNGTSPCNGDSGGGFHVFVPDNRSDERSGAWYVRGIVSLSASRSDVALCDPNQYVIFTDVSKYRPWLSKYLN